MSEQIDEQYRQREEVGLRGNPPMNVLHRLVLEDELLRLRDGAPVGTDLVDVILMLVSLASGVFILAGGWHFGLLPEGGPSLIVVGIAVLVLCFVAQFLVMDSREERRRLVRIAELERLLAAQGAQSRPARAE